MDPLFGSNKHLLKISTGVDSFHLYNIKQDLPAPSLLKKADPRELRGWEMKDINWKCQVDGGTQDLNNFSFSF